MRFRRVGPTLAVTALAACFAHRAPQQSRVMHGDAMLDLTEARADFRRGDFSKAQLELRRVQFELAASQPEVAEVRYLIAECDFQLGDHSAAALEFRKVADEYPSSPFAALSLLRSGDANLRLWRRPELDPTPGQTALATYQELQGRFPGTPAATRAQLHVRQLNEWFAEKDYKTGMFYFRRHAYDAAIIYFKDIIATFPSAKQVPDALLRLVDSYHAIGYAAEMREACDNMRRYYPKTSGLDHHCPPSLTAPSSAPPAAAEVGLDSTAHTQ
ncbi:MAG TPA: outer membrane protein assembly factor BamD [Gemmatimonadales bacterium]|nr:outer membrane protein assembly factor BamD [Gemmatimonadales bacterium]